MPSKNPSSRVRFSDPKYHKRFKEMAEEKGLTLNEFMIAYAFQGYMAEKLGKMKPYEKGTCPYVPTATDKYKDGDE